MLLKDYVNTSEYEELAGRVKQATVELKSAIEHIHEVCSDVDDVLIAVGDDGNLVKITSKRLLEE